MTVRTLISCGPRPATAWLACLMVILLLVVSLISVSHRVHSDHADHHDCAACLIAHGGLAADGASGALVISFGFGLTWLAAAECRAASVFDLFLVPGRGPPA